MYRKIILTSKIKHYWLLAWLKVYGRKSLLNSSNNPFAIIEEDIFSVSDSRKCANEASSIEEHLLAILVNNSGTEFLSEWGGNKYVRYFTGLAVIQEAREVFLAFRYAEKICKKYNINENVYIWSDAFSWTVYKEIRKLGVLPKNIQLHPLLVAYVRIHGMAKYIYFFVKSLLFIEARILKMKDYNVSDKYYKNIVHLDDALFYEYPNLTSSITTDKILKLFPKNGTLFLNDTESGYKWEKILLKAGYSVLKLDDATLWMSRKKYLLMYYVDHFIFRAKLLFLSWSSPWLIASCYRALRYRVLWDIFYHHVSTSSVIRMMLREDITSSIMHKKHDTKTVFTYFSVSTNAVDKKIDNSKSSNHDYTHMIFDYMISNKISNEYIKTHENSVGEYVELGPIFSDIIRDNFYYRSEIIGQINIPKNVKIISFLDNSFGHKGVLTISSLNAFIEAILLLSKNKNIYFLFKSKKSLEDILLNAGKKSVELIEKIRLCDNTIYINDYDLDSLKLISISDLVISAPISSVMFESIFGGVKAITYDPFAQYKEYSIVSTKLQKVYATSFNELEELIKYWLTFTIDEKVESCLLNSVYKNFDDACYEHFINKYKEFIN